MRGRNYSLCRTLGNMRRFWVGCRLTGSYPGPPRLRPRRFRLDCKNNSGPRIRPISSGPTVGWGHFGPEKSGE
jgi:hypothetical protein